MTEFLMKPKVDFAFKEIMMNENARIGFLSAILKLSKRYKRNSNFKYKSKKITRR